MKKILRLIIGLAILYAVHHYMDRYQLKKASLGFVTGAVNAIAASWDPAVFNTYADGSLKTAKNIPAVFANYRKLGKLSQPMNCDITDFSSYKYREKGLSADSANYECAAEFENGTATLFLTIYGFPELNQWKITWFDLQSPYFNVKAKK